MISHYNTCGYYLFFWYEGVFFLFFAVASLAVKIAFVATEQKSNV
jgi:hypothetical protein